MFRFHQRIPKRGERCDSAAASAAAFAWPNAVVGADAIQATVIIGSSTLESFFIASLVLGTPRAGDGVVSPSPETWSIAP